MANPKLTIDLLLNNQSARGISDQVAKSLNEAAKKWGDDVKEMAARGFESGFRIALSSGRSGGAIQKFLKTNITDVYSKFQKELNLGNVEAAEKLERILDKRTRRFEREAKAQVDAFEAMNERAARTWSQNADSFRENIEGINRAMHMRDPSGYLGLGRQLGGRIQEAGRARMERARRIKEAGGDAGKAKMMSMGGAAVAGLGTALVTIAAVAAAVLALIKLFMDLNDRIVEMNKNILQTGTISDMGIGGRAFEAGHRFRTQLDDMRTSVLDAASDFGGMRVSADELFQTLGALNEHGRGFEKITENIKDGTAHLNSYGEAAENAVAYAKLMGMQSQDMARHMSAWSNDFGQDMERVYEGLQAVRQEAMLSGFTMKRFVSTIAEATSGMGAYAVRLEEAGKTLKFLSNIMGETAGAELFKSLTNAFTEATTSDRLKRILTTGTSEMQRVFADQAAANAEGLFKDLEALGGVKGVESGADLANMLGQMNEKDRITMMAQLKKAGAEPELIMRMDNLIETVRAGNGDLAAMTNAMSDLGPAGTLATLTQSQVFGGRMLHEFVAEEGVAGRAAAEQMTGMSGKSFEYLVDASRQTSADMMQLRKIQEAVRNDGLKISKDQQAKLASLYGATVTQTGEIVGATYDMTSGLLETGTKITDEQGLMLAQNDRYKAVEEKAVSEDIKLARQIAKSTEKLANVMEANMLKVLNKIYFAVKGFWTDFLNWWGTEDPGIQGRIGAENRLLDVEQRAARELERNNKEIAEWRETLQQEQDPIKKKAAEEAIETLLAANSELQEAVEGAELATQILQNLETEGKSQAKILEEVREKLEEKGIVEPTFMGSQNAARERMGELLTEDLFRDTVKEFWDQDNLDEVVDVISSHAASAGGLTMGQHMRLRQKLEEERYGHGPETMDEYVGRLGGVAAREVDAIAAEWDDVRRVTEETNKAISDIKTSANKMLASQEEQTEEQKNLTTALAPQPVGDFILRPGERPILTDPNDTLMGFKPGGAFGMGGGGGGGGPVNVNIYGGDPKKVYQEVMRVMKALGHA